MMQIKNQEYNRCNSFISTTAFIMMVFAVVLLCTWVCAESNHAGDAEDFLLLNTPGTVLSGSSHNAQALSLEDRIACQEAIERIYWNHRIWPQDNKQAKPAFESIMPAEVLRAKVEDLIRKSNAIEQYWNRPVTGEQLQAEMNRIAANTKNAGMLKELWAALHNEPHAIAECLARPMLVNRILPEWYGYDERIHHALKLQAENDVMRYSDVSQMKWMSGKFSEMRFIKIKKEDRRAKKPGTAADTQSIKLTENEWKELIQTLGQDFSTALLNEDDTSELTPQKLFDALPQSRISALQEDKNRFYILAIIEKRADILTIATVEWQKMLLEKWFESTAMSLGYEIKEPVFEYTLPAINDNPCVFDTWLPTKLEMPAGRIYHTAVWSGTEMIIWGGHDWIGNTNTGGRYNPSTDSWTLTSLTNAPEARSYHTAVWSGTEMIVWGGLDVTNFITGGRYNPNTDTWIATNTVGAPSARIYHSAIWDGNGGIMIIWGGNGLNTGARYNPGTNSWTATTTVGAPAARGQHTAIWDTTNKLMVVWGGGNLNTGGRYEPTGDTWTPTTTSGAPAGRSQHTAVWDSTHGFMIVWGGRDATSNLNTGGRYNPGTDVWTPTNTTGAPAGRYRHTAVWTGSEMIVWGGTTSTIAYDNTGGRYNPGTDLWTATSISNAGSPRRQHTAVWTGTEMIVWGGYGAAYENTGARYTPGSTDSWVPTGGIVSRRNHTAVWTGAEMIIWGGYAGRLAYQDRGANYYPGIDSWTDTSMILAPTARYIHTAVWTGTDMIVWGGYGYTSATNTGGRYNPISDSWLSVATTNAPEARYYHTAVWSGAEMIVWGGFNSTSYLNTGGKYNALTDTWQTMTTVNAPSGRAYHTTVWTGTEMIVWGGFDEYNYFQTGGRYTPGSSPGTDSWTATSLAGAPVARYDHVAVWTGTKMIIWGGYNGNYPNPGGEYTVSTNSWLPTALTNAPVSREWPSAVWTGHEMIVWSGSDDDGYLNTGGRYNPDTRVWFVTSTVNAPAGRMFHTTVLTPTEMIVWGGGPYLTNTGGRYCIECSISPPATITVSEIMPNEARIDWSTVAGATGYNVYRKYYQCNQWIGELIGNNVGSNWFIDPSLQGGITYYYSVSAIGSQCESDEGTWASVTASGDCFQMPCFDGAASVMDNQSSACILTVTWNPATSRCPAYPGIYYTLYRNTDPLFIPGPANQIATCLLATTYIDGSVVYGALSYYYIVRAEDSRIGGGGPCNTGNADDNLNRKNGTPTGVPTIYFSDGFESGLGQWTVSLNWNQNSTQSHSGTYSAHSGNVPDQACDTLTQTGFTSLPSGSSPKLRFWTRYQAEINFDGGIVEGSSNGTSWVTLPLTPDYPGQMIPSGSTSDCLMPLGNPINAFSGYDGTTWTRYTSDLTPYMGSNFKMRFNYASDSSFMLGGWWIDDVRIESPTACVTLPSPGTVPDNDNFPGIPLKISKSSNNLILHWSPPGGSCQTQDYGIYRGSLPWSGYNHLPVVCSTGGSTTITIPAGAASFYYLAVAQNGGREGSYGVDSYDSQRPASSSPCLPQDINFCEF